MAYSFVDQRRYDDPDFTAKKPERDAEIFHRIEAGTKSRVLATAYGVTTHRVRQLYIREREKRQRVDAG